MKVVRYVNGRKVPETPGSDAESTNPAVPAKTNSQPNKRIITKVTPIPPQQPAKSSKGCGCGK